MTSASGKDGVSLLASWLHQYLQCTSGTSLIRTVNCAATLKKKRTDQTCHPYCPGHAGVSGNKRAVKLSSTADITPGLQFGRADMLRGFRNFLNRDRPEHPSIDRLKERGEEKGSGRHSALQGRERSVFNQANIGTASRAACGRLLRDGAVSV